MLLPPDRLEPNEVKAHGSHSPGHPYIDRICQGAPGTPGGAAKPVRQGGILNFFLMYVKVKNSLSTSSRTSFLLQQMLRENWSLVYSWPFLVSDSRMAEN